MQRAAPRRSACRAFLAAALGGAVLAALGSGNPAPLLVRPPSASPGGGSRLFFAPPLHLGLAAPPEPRLVAAIEAARAAPLSASVLEKLASCF